MTAPAHVDVEPPEPPAELFGLVWRDSPAVQEVEDSLAKWGYSHTKPMALSDGEIVEAGLLIVRGCCFDTIYPDTAEGRAAWKTSRR